MAPTLEIVPKSTLKKISIKMTNRNIYMRSITIYMYTNEAAHLMFG